MPTHRCPSCDKLLHRAAKLGQLALQRSVVVALRRVVRTHGRKLVTQSGHFAAHFGHLAAHGHIVSAQHAHLAQQCRLCVAQRLHSSFECCCCLTVSTLSRGYASPHAACQSCLCLHKCAPATSPTSSVQRCHPTVAPPKIRSPLQRQTAARPPTWRATAPALPPMCAARSQRATAAPHPATAHATASRPHCAQCASMVPSGPAHPHRQGHRAPIAAMTKRTAGLAVGSPRHGLPQRGHCRCLGSAAVAQRAQHRWPSTQQQRGGKAVSAIALASSWVCLCVCSGACVLMGAERRADPCRR